MGKSSKKSHRDKDEKPPELDPSDSKEAWRIRHHIAFLALAGGTPALNLFIAIFLIASHDGLGASSWAPAFVLSLFQAIYIGAGVTLIERKTLARSHKDLGIIMFPLWSAGLVADIIFLWGGFASGTGGTMLYAETFLIVLSEFAGLGTCIMSIQQHILLLYNPRAVKSDSDKGSDKDDSNAEGDGSGDDHESGNENGDEDKADAKDGGEQDETGTDTDDDQPKKKRKSKSRRR